MNLDIVERAEQALSAIPFLRIEYLKQNAMRSVVNSLAPVIVGAVYFFGWRSLFVNECV